MEIEDPAALYADTRAKAIAIFSSLTDEEATTTVPLTPLWRVVDVAAHVCGIVDDVVHGNIGGLGTDAWTAAQVEKRAGTPIGEICAEWTGYGPQVDAMIGDNPFFGARITGDLIVHVHDVQHALGLDIDRNDLATRVAAHRYVSTLQERALDQVGTGIRIELADGDTYEAPTDANSVIGLRASSYDFLRSVTGRRSRSQVEALDWDGDPAAILEGAWNTYGPFRVEDVSV